MIVFQKSGLSDLTMERGRIVPYSPEEIEIDQIQNLTENNIPIIVDYGNNLTFINLEFNHLSKDNYDGATNGLKTWFSSSQVNWMANNFTMIDENGVSHTVRLWDKKFKFQTLGSGRYNISIKLLKES